MKLTICPVDKRYLRLLLMDALYELNNGVKLDFGASFFSTMKSQVIY